MNVSTTSTPIAPNKARVRNRIDSFSILACNVERRALDALGQRLFPHDDVAALDPSRRRVVERDLAGQVQAHGDQLITLPADVADLFAGRGPHLLRELEGVAFA